MKLTLLILFLAAFTSQAVLMIAYWLMDMRPNPQLTWTALSLCGVCVALMVTLAIMSRNMKTRWLSVGLIGSGSPRVLRADYRQPGTSDGTHRARANSPVHRHADMERALPVHQRVTACRAYTTDSIRSSATRASAAVSSSTSMRLTTTPSLSPSSTHDTYAG